MKPDDIVTWPGVGSMTLRSAVRRFMALPPDHRLAVSLLRDGNPSLIDPADLEALVKLPDYQGDD
jgi:hypothetical protein